VGKGIRLSGVKREELFVTTKLWNTEHSYEAALKAFDVSMDKLGLEYLDLYLIHWPNPPMFRDRWQEANAETWKALEALYTAGRVRAIGVSNFRRHHIDALLKTAKVVPAVNQIRLCPGETQDDTVAASREQGMILEAYSPLGVGRIFEVPEVKALAEKYGKTVAQVVIRWSLERGYLPLPKSVTPSRIAENADVFGFELDAEDVALLAGMAGVCGFSADPDKTDF
jgi:diketogulonate reductase-like aldo/keto reductase